MHPVVAKMTRCYTAGMTFLRLYRRFGAWLAILALLAGALSPTLAQAMVTGSDRADWLEGGEPRLGPVPGLSIRPTLRS